MARAAAPCGRRPVTLSSDCKASVGSDDAADAVPKHLSAVQVKRALRQDCESFLVSVRKVVGAKEPDRSDLGAGGSSSGVKHVQEWVQDNTDVFLAQLPDGLPPERGVGHTIPQLPGSKPVMDHYTG